MSGDRERLIAALECSDIDLRIPAIADALMPVVERIAAERAAAELRAAGKWLRENHYRTPAWHLAAIADRLDPS